MRLIYAALILLGLTGAPLLAVGLLDAGANPIGLGLLFMAGTFGAAVLVILAGLLAAWRHLHPKARR